MVARGGLAGVRGQVVPDVEGVALTLGVHWGHCGHEGGVCHVFPQGSVQQVLLSACTKCFWRMESCIGKQTLT